ncbi:CU044_5270 family protein [Dactylosporangium sp. NBC_01737]|uniref:CU044_5270 family protein n=1 Tax=Dactylosporangium sp. NBC_01737 TaxID=2975959 RepID=UPI002E13C4C1|nr:CU044_5270 family protein [Dactylosporangium sp. NBC_01737]
MSTRPDVMQLLADARPGRLDPDVRPAPGPFTAPVERSRRPVARRLILAGALPLVAAATAAAVVLTGGGTGPSSPPATPATGAPDATAAAPPDSARALLLVAAEKTAAGDTASSGRYWVRVQEYGERKDVGRYAIASRMSIERWLATGAGDPTVDVGQALGAVPLTAADEAAWKADGSPTQWTENGPPGTKPIVRTTSPGPRTVRPLPGGELLMIAGQRVTTADLAALPTDPAALQAWLTARLRQGGGTEREDLALFYAGRDLVAELPVSAAVRSAAYRMLADLQGVDFLGVVQDRHGRSGMAVAFTRRGDGGWGQQRLIVDPGTGRALAQESWFFGSGGAPAATGMLMSWTVQVSARYTDEDAPTA